MLPDLTVPYTSFLHMATPKHQVVQLSEMLKRRVEERREMHASARIERSARQFLYKTFALNSPRAVFFFSVVLIVKVYKIL